MSRKGKKNNPPDEIAASAESEYIHDIGARLKAARMARNLTLKTAAMRSGLDRSIVKKIEQNRFADIGAHVFTMDHVVRYARYLNISKTGFSFPIMRTTVMRKIPLAIRKSDFCA